MGIISVNDLDRLFWAGRYGERALEVYTRYTALPSDERIRRQFAEKLCCAEEGVHPDLSILGADGTVHVSLVRWHENALQLRHILSSEAVRQAEIAVNDYTELNSFGELATRAYAFFGRAEDELNDVTARCAQRAGRMVERLDILSRMGEDVYLVEEALRRLEQSAQDSAAVGNLISGCQLQLAAEDLARGNVSAIKIRTPYMESNNEFA